MDFLFRKLYLCSSSRLSAPSYFLKLLSDPNDFIFFILVHKTSVMKPLSISVVAVATIFLLLCTSFRSDKKMVLPYERKPAVDNIHYYFYLNNGTVYDGYYTIYDEISRLETIYGVYVDGSPLGGTLLASGYPFKGIPHLTYAASFLYGHF